MPSDREWSNLALLKLGAFGFGINGFVLAMDTVLLPVLVLVVASEGLKNTYLGLLGFSGLLVAALAQPVIGRMSDRTRSFLGRRVPYMLLGCALVCLGIAGIGLAPSYSALFIVWLCIQASINVAYGPYQALIQDLVPAHRFGVASSLKILSDAVGGVTLIAMSGVFIGRYIGSEFDGWLWLTLGLLGINLIVGTVITSLTVRAREGSAGARATDWASRWPAVKRLHPQLRWFVCSRLLMITAIAVFQTYGLFFLRDVVRLENPAQALASMIVVIGGALALSVYPAGWLSDRIGRKPVVLAGAVGAATGAIFMLTASSATEVLVIASIIGASVGTLLTANWAMANDLGTSGQEGLHIGIVNLATIGGWALAKALGPGIDLLNRLSPGAGYDVLLVGSAALFIMGALLLMPLKREARDVLSSERA